MEKSETINKLTAALVKFQGQMLKVGKDSINPHFKNRYASLSTIIEATQKPLADCGLAIIQLPEGENCLRTMLVHESGEFISESYRMTPSKNDPQGLGSAITYQRRYALGAILNLNIDEDDDGNQASAKPQRKVDIAAIVKELEGCQSVDDMRKVWAKVPTSAREQLKETFAAKRAELEGGAK
jgi:hypothetical protein